MSLNIVLIRSRFSTPYAMLARQHATHLDAEPQDVVAERLRALQLSRLVRVIHDQRVQIAVARVKHIGHAQTMLRLHLLHAQSDTSLTRRRGMVPSMHR